MTYKPLLRKVLWVLTFALLSACTSVRAPSKADPFEGFNRAVFTFNDTVDEAAIKPVAKAYNWVLPQGMRTSVTNVFSNIGDISIAANSFLQGKMVNGFETVMRIAINTVFGVGGLFDVATQAKLPKHTADFGLTLGHYGVPMGPYLVLPILGPSTIRDAVGTVADRQMLPTSYIDPWWISVTLSGIRLLNVRASLIEAGDLLTDVAFDKYSFVRDGYIQRRQYLQSDGKAALPDYSDDGDEGNNTKNIDIKKTESVITSEAIAQ